MGDRFNCMAFLEPDFYLGEISGEVTEVDIKV